VALPLDPGESKALLSARGFNIDNELAWALSLLTGGNPRELIRIAGLLFEQSIDNGLPTYNDAIITVLREEASAFLYEIIRDSGGSASPELSHEEKPPPKLIYEEKSGAWRALDIHSFSSADQFTPLGKSAILQYWDPEWAGVGWEAVQESWRRLLIRLFVAASLIEDHSSEVTTLSSNVSAIIDMRDLMLFAGRDAGVARLMLEARFGPKLTDRYNAEAFAFKHQRKNYLPTEHNG
jgi:hypothetical protein